MNQIITKRFIQQQKQQWIQKQVKHEKYNSHFLQDHTSKIINEFRIARQMLLLLNTNMYVVPITASTPLKNTHFDYREALNFQRPRLKRSADFYRVISMYCNVSPEISTPCFQAELFVSVLLSNKALQSKRFAFTLHLKSFYHVFFRHPFFLNFCCSKFVECVPLFEEPIQNQTQI